MATPMDIKDKPSDTVFYMSAQIHISAPASHVFNILTRGNTWPEWNSFCPAVKVTHADSNGSTLEEGEIALNANMAMTVRMDPALPDSLRTQNVVVTEFTRPEGSANKDGANTGDSYRVSWRAQGIPRFLLRADRTSECVRANDDSSCEFRTWEFMAGPLAYVVNMMYGTALQARFEETAVGLKEYAEKTWQSGQHN